MTNRTYHALRPSCYAPKRSREPGRRAMEDRVIRPVWGVLGALALLLPVLPLGAADCSSLAGHSITWIVPYSPGGGFDVESRLLAPHLSQVLGADVAVQNVSGAGGLVGAKAIRDAAPDGRTIGVING